jgi:hypothetical protein
VQTIAGRRETLLARIVTALVLCLAAWESFMKAQF